MKKLLLQIERKIQELIEEKSLDIFGMGKANKGLIEAILNSMKSNLLISEDGRVHSPNLFAIHFPERFSDEIKSNLDFSQKLIEIVETAGDSLDIVIDKPIEINIYSDDQLVEGEFKVFSSFLSERQTETKKMIYSANESGEPGKSDAYLIVKGIDIFPFTETVTNLGRNKDSHLVIKNPNVSRMHAQIRNIGGMYVLSDMGSTGGTLVNEQKIQQVTLHPGDVISLAGVLLVFGNEAAYSLEDTKEFLVNKQDKDEPIE